VASILGDNMAWLLIRAFSDDKPTAWKIGDIVEVRSDEFVDEHGWGNLEGLPRFYRIQITGLSAEKIKHFLEETDEEDTGELTAKGLPKTKFNRIRKRLIDVTGIPTVIKNQLNNTGIVSVTVNQIKNYLKNNKGDAEVLPT
jgi:hypothetical protein